MEPTGTLYRIGDIINLTAEPDPGWNFLSWLGDVTGNTPAVELSIAGPACVESLFGTEIRISVAGSGHVISKPETSLNPFGTPLCLTAVPEAGQHFDHWEGSVAGTNNPVTASITNSETSLTAVFSKLPDDHATLSLLSSGAGSVSSHPSANFYPKGTVVSITALPEANQQFLEWTGSLAGNQNPFQVTLQSNMVVKGRFTATVPLSIFMCGPGRNHENFRMQLHGPLGESYRLEHSSNLAHWIPEFRFTNDYGSIQLNQEIPSTASQRFFRAIWEP
jgi:hypothetical protein